MQEKKSLLEIAKLWKNEKKQYVKKSSFAAYSLLIENHLIPLFGDKFDVQESEIQDFVLKKIEQGLSQKTIKDILIVLKMLLKFGAKNKWIQYNPIDIQYPTAREAYRIEVLSRSNQKILMKYVEDHFTFKNLGIYICLSSGIRIGEVCALTWDDLDIDNGVIRIKRTIQRIYNLEEEVRKTEIILDTPKTKNSIREIPISRDLMNLIKPVKKIVNPDFFILTNDSKPTEPRTYRNYYKELLS